MFRKLSKVVNYLKLKKLNEHQEKSNGQDKKENIPKSINEIKDKLRTIFEDGSDFVLREFSIGEKSEIKLILAYIDGLANKQVISMDILQPLIIESKATNIQQYFHHKNLIDILKKNLLLSCELEDVTDFKETIDAILSGDTMLYVDGHDIALKACSKGWASRAVDEPDTESVIKGPREGFVESLRTNTSLLRRKIKSPKLKFEMMQIGKQTKTDVCICYLKGIANEDILKTVRRRLEKIKIDGILAVGYIEQFIEDAPFSPLSTVGNSEKPDKVAAKILEGRIAIICDGTPVVITVPYLFIEGFQSSEDYYTRTYYASFNRILRFFALAIAAVLPSFYVALISFHSDVIPIELLLSILSTRENVPFSPFVEATFMGVVFELLKEAGVRMPKAVGQAVNIVGALVIGDAAVKAGLVSPIMIIVVALTGIATFIVPPFSDMLPILRMYLVIAANILGFLGIFIVLVAFYIHASSLRSFGVPYMSPFAPLSGTDLKDTFIRVPMWMMLTRPRAITWENTKDTKYRMEKTFVKKED
ncbi:spore germination protein [Anaerosolibacter sp.]|uniref:spore germination protein n=1 Tax=Anaerosolibacter sp. TaxID=1872527 RepID=UPI0039F102BE